MLVPLSTAFCATPQARSETLYCFDFLELLEAGVKEQWAAYAKDRAQVRAMERWSRFCPGSFSFVLSRVQD